MDFEKESRKLAKKAFPGDREPDGPFIAGGPFSFMTGDDSLPRKVKNRRKGYAKAKTEDLPLMLECHEELLNAQELMFRACTRLDLVDPGSAISTAMKLAIEPLKDLAERVSKATQA